MIVGGGVDWGAAGADAVVDGRRGLSHARAAEAGKSGHCGILAEQRNHSAICGRVDQVLEINVPLRWSRVAVSIEPDLRDRFTCHWREIADAIFPSVGGQGALANILPVLVV